MMDNIEESYPKILSDLLKFIDYLKSKDKDKILSIVDIIIEFSDKYDLDVDLVGEAIGTDEFFKAYVKKDCELRNIIPTDKKQMQEW